MGLEKVIAQMASSEAIARTLQVELSEAESNKILGKPRLELYGEFRNNLTCTNSFLIRRGARVYKVTVTDHDE